MYYTAICHGPNSEFLSCSMQTQVLFPFTSVTSLGCSSHVSVHCRKECFCPVWSAFGTQAIANSHIQREQPPFCSWLTGCAVPGCSALTAAWETARSSSRFATDLSVNCTCHWDDVVPAQLQEQNAERFLPQLYNFLILEWVASSVLTRQSGRIPQSGTWTLTVLEAI